LRFVILHNVQVHRTTSTLGYQAEREAQSGTWKLLVGDGGDRMVAWVKRESLIHAAVKLWHVAPWLARHLAAHMDCLHCLFPLVCITVFGHSTLHR
jgi:hypothetical protein